jgi:superkiller protein 3
MGRGYVLEYAQKYQEASQLFYRVTQVESADSDLHLRAEEEHAWCLCCIGDTEKGSEGLKVVISTLNTLEDRETDRARALWRVGKCYWDRDGKRVSVDHQN